MAAYEAFARVYDRLMDDIDYDGWAQYYLDLIARAGIRPGTLCDCACGTGSLSVRFAARNLRVTGVDLSGTMLAAAQDKARAWGVQAMFVRQDMCRLALPRPVDALVCGCDGVNYLITDDQLLAFFESAYKALKPAGALAFDVSSAYKLETQIANGFFGEDRDDVTYLWNNRLDAQRRIVVMELAFFVRRRDGLYERFDETHVQKAHDPEHLKALMEACGFKVQGIYGDRTFEAPGATEARLHFLAVRQ